MILDNTLNTKSVDELLDLQERIESDIQKESDGYLVQALRSDLDAISLKLQELVSEEYAEQDSLVEFVKSF